MASAATRGTASSQGREALVDVSVGWRVAADLAVLDDLRVVGEVPLEPFVFGQRGAERAGFKHLDFHDVPLGQKGQYI